MLKSFVSILFISIISFLFISQAYAQEIDIVPYLKQIEKGNKEKVEEELPKLEKEHPHDPSIMFLKGVLTENGQQAVSVYNNLLKKYPKSRYADAALYRIYTYYYALGMYNVAKEELNRLKKNYPNSPYLEIAKKNIPSKNNIITTEKKNSSSVKSGKNSSPEKDENQKYKYTIQAGAFSIPSNAESLMKSFKASGYYTKIEDKIIAATTFHIVYVGKFSNEEDAKNMLRLINSKYNLDGRIIPINQ